MNDGVLRKQLRAWVTAQRLATGMLLVMGALLLVLHWFAPSQPAWSYATAFAEAALVGGLADWFAVTALFRHPLGLPIPHTAIIPSNRQRLADSIADFLEHNFLTQEVLERELARLDFAALTGHYLSSPVHCRWLVRRCLHQGGSLIESGPLLAAVIHRFIDLGRHDMLFDRLVNWVARSIEQHQGFIYQKVSQKSPRWMPRRLNDEFFVRLVDGLAELLDDIRQPASSARQQFADSLHQLAQQLASGQEAPLNDPLAGSLSGLLDGRPVARQLEHQLQLLGERLLNDPGLRHWLNLTLVNWSASWLVGQRHEIVGLVRRVVLSWDEQSLVERVELHVGRDLQFIRMNGTVVGGLVGVLLHGLRELPIW